jgi:hypothetical protein
VSRLDDAAVVLGVIQDDIRHVHVRVTAALGIVAAFVTQIKLQRLRALDDAWEVAMLAGLGLMVLAAMCYFQYSQELNKARIEISARIGGLHGPGEKDDPATWLTQPWTPFIEKRHWYELRARGTRVLYTVGQASFLLGGLVLIPVLAKILD